MKYCSKCGASVEPSAAFCSGCGTTLSAESASPTSGFWKGVAASVVGLAVVLGALWATMGSNSANPERGQPVAAADGPEVRSDATSGESPSAASGESPAANSVSNSAPSSTDVVTEEPGFVGRLLGEKPRVFVTVSDGTELTVALRETISTESASPGDPFDGVLARAVVVEGHDALPAGTLVSGHVAHAKRSDKVKGLAELTLELDSLELASGEELRVVAEPVRFEARSTKKDDAVKIGGGAGVGALVGGILGGKKGAAIGAGVGAGAGSGAVLATRGEELVLGDGFELSTRLRGDIRVELVVDPNEVSDES